MSGDKQWWEELDSRQFFNKQGHLRTQARIETPQGTIFHPSLVDIDHFIERNDSVRDRLAQLDPRGAMSEDERRRAAFSYLQHRAEPFERAYSFGDSRLWNDAAAEAYARANPDIADALRSGVMPDPLYHFLRYGFNEGRSWIDSETGKPVGEGPRQPFDPDTEYKPKDDLQASTLESIRRWNDYVDRFIPLENEFLRRAVLTESNKNLGRGQVHAESRFELGDAMPEVRLGLASQGVAPGSGRAFMTEAGLQSGADVGSGDAQGAMAQGLVDRGIDARMKFSAHGRGLQDHSMLSLHNAADRAMDANLSSINRRANQSSSAMGLMGAIAGGATMGYLNRRPSGSPAAAPAATVGGQSPAPVPGQGGFAWDRVNSV